MLKIVVLIATLFLGEVASSENIANEESRIKDKRPNILLILADDLGYSDIGAFGGEIATPNLDSLAKNGVRMSNFYVAATCSPTRSMLLSGVDHHLAGMGTMAGDQAPNQLGKAGYEGYLNHDVVSIATLMRESGYHTYMAGKWHLGLTEKLSPKSRGFEKSFALLQGGGHHFDDTTMIQKYDKAWYREDDKRVELPDDFYSSEYYSTKMIEYMKTGEQDDQPFFAYLTYTAPHWPLQAPQEYMNKYKGKYDDGYSVLKANRLQAMHDLGLINKNSKVHPTSEPDTADWNSLSPETKKVKSREMEIYAAMVDNMDYQLGRVLEYLESSGQRDNTLIIFFSDNGPQSGSVGKISEFPQSWIDANFDNSYENMGKKGSYIYYDTHWAEASVPQSRLFKAFATEGGLNVPGIINFPGKLGELSGKISNQFMTVLDVAPTILELAETSHPGSSYKGKTVVPPTGTSAVSFINGTSDTIHGEEYTMSWELFDRMAVRNGDWKLLKLPTPFGTGEWELFNLAQDPGETTDLRLQHPEQLSKMIKIWDEYVNKNNVVLPRW